MLTVRGRLLANAVTARLISDDPVAATGDGAAGLVVAVTGAAGTIPPYA